MRALTFDAPTHTYTLGGRILPSVTRIMEPMSLILYRDVPPDVLAAAADRGTRAHEQISNYVKYGITETDVDTECYFSAFQKFTDDYRPVWLDSELRTYHKALLYAGTADLLGYIEPDSGEGEDVVDIKCTRVYHSVMLATQLGGYAEALKSQGVRIRERYGLQLLQDGMYRFERVADGFKMFLHCMAIFQAMNAEKMP